MTNNKLSNLKILCLLMTMSILISGCHLPSLKDQDIDTDEAVKLTLAALDLENESPNEDTAPNEQPEATITATGPKPSATPTATPTTTQARPNNNPNNPAPTDTITATLQKPTTNAPTAADPLTINNMSQNVNTVYFGFPPSNLPTSVSIQATIEPLNRVHAVDLVYYFCNFNDCFGPFFEPMVQLGIGDYQGDINGLDAELYMTEVGWIAYWIDAYDVDGNLTSSQENTLPLDYIAQVTLFPVINSFTSSDVDFLQGDTMIFYWDTDYGNCGVYLNGEKVAEDGSKAILADTTGQFTFALTVEGGSDCTNPDAVTETIVVEVTSPLPPAIISSGDHFKLEFDVYYDFDTSAGINPEAFFTIQNNTFTLMTNQAVMTWFSGIPDYQDCASTATAGFGSATVGPGTVICYSTDEGNVGYLEVHEVQYDDPTDTYYAIFSFITWGSP
jgi:hypothetical protein